jgi:hypothetical protein
MLTPHRQSPNRPRELRERIWAKVEAMLGKRVICGRCRATSATYGDLCDADLGEKCPGRLAIETAEREVVRQLGLA